MVLNNLFFVSAKFGDDHHRELEDVWSAMVACWPDNMRCIIRYVIIVTGMTPEQVLPFVSHHILPNAGFLSVGQGDNSPLKQIPPFPEILSRVYTGSRRELARVFVSFLLAICPNSSRLTVYTDLRVDLHLLANDYIDNNGFSNMTKTYSAKTAGVNCCLQSAKLFAQALATFCK